MRDQTERCAKWPRRRVLKYILLTPVIVFALFLIGRRAWYEWEDARGADTTMDAYLIRKGQRVPVDEPFFLFPDRETAMQAEDRDYFYRYDYLMLLSLMFDDDMIAYLRCSYTQEQYARELERLERLCGNFAS